MELSDFREWNPTCRPPGWYSAWPVECIEGRITWEWMGSHIILKYVVSLFACILMKMYLFKCIFACYRKHVCNHMSDDSGNLFFTISVLRTPAMYISKRILTWLISSLSLSFSLNSSKVTGLVMTALRQNEVTWLQNLYHEYFLGVYSLSVYAWILLLTSVDIYIYIFFFHCFLDLMKDPYTWKDILNSWCKYIYIYRYVPGLTTIPAHYPLASHQLWGWSKGWCQARGSFSC